MSKSKKSTLEKYLPRILQSMLDKERNIQNESIKSADEKTSSKFLSDHRRACPWCGKTIYFYIEGKFCKF